MKWTSPELVSQWLWDARWADLPRGTNRALIDRLFNGLPPYLGDDHRCRPDKTNVNFLEGSRLAADARRSYYNAFLKPGYFFNVNLDYGPVFKRKLWSSIIAREWNKVMKANRKYFEFLRSQFALTVVHGIGPGFWMDRESWVPRCVGVEDVMIPSNTLLTMENLNYFGIFRQYTAMELYQMTHGQKVDPAWNMPVVEACLKWVNEQLQAEPGYNEFYSPEKVEERWHQDLGFYGSDAVPTVDCWDFYFYSDEKNQQGWRRRIVLDTPMPGTIPMARETPSMPRKNLIGQDHDQWLYKPADNRVYAPSIEQIIHFQFADASANAPFRYHSVRSLGKLLYAVCHLQNRMRCSVNDAVFESLLQYFWATDEADKERIEKVELTDLGVVPQGLKFVTQAERWKVDQNLVTMGLEQNQSMMQESAAQYREGRNAGQKEGEPKTATQVMAEVNAANALVGAMLMQAYCYHKFQGIEIARRFCIKNSKDPDVRKFRVNVLKAGVPEEALDSSCWEIEPERVLGNGNKTLEIAMADKLMAARPLHDPESQREILFLYDLANSDNPDLAQRLTPLEKGRVSDSVSEATLMLPALMLGEKVPITKGLNPEEVCQTLLAGLGTVMEPFVKGDEQPTPREMRGMAGVILAIGEWLSVLSGDPAKKELVKQLSDGLSQADAMLKKLAHQSAKQMPQAGGNGADAAKEAIKLQSAQKMGELKIALAAKSHAQRTQSRDVQTRMGMIQDQQRHDMEMQHKAQDAALDANVKLLQASTEQKRSRLKSLEE